MSRRWSRSSAALASIAMVGSLLIATAGGATAATTRSVLFESPGASGNLELLPSTSMPGGVSAYDVTLQNTSNGTLTQLVVTGGDQTPDPTSNGAFVPDNICTLQTDGSYSCLPPLPSGSSGSDGQPWAATIAGVYHPTDVSCSFSGTAPAYTGFACTVSDLHYGQSVLLRVLVQFPANAPTGDSYAIWNATQWKEGQSSSGANADAAYALGYAPVAAPECTVVDKFFDRSIPTASLSNTERDPTDPTVTQPCDQTTMITTANGSLGSYLTVGSDLSSTQCLPGFKCFGGLSIGLLMPQLFDPTLPPEPIVHWYVKWTWSAALKKTNPKGIIHFRDGYPADPTAYDVIYFSSKGECATPTSTGCWTQQLSTSTYFEVYFQTRDNGSGRGF
jgi:hypothetical protein